MQASQFSLKEVEVATAVVDLDDIRAYRADKASMQEQASLRHGSARSGGADGTIAHTAGQGDEYGNM